MIKRTQQFPRAIGLAALRFITKATTLFNASHLRPFGALGLSVKLNYSIVNICKCPDRQKDWGAVAAWKLRSMLLAARQSKGMQTQACPHSRQAVVCNIQLPLSMTLKGFCVIWSSNPGDLFYRDKDGFLGGQQE